MFSGRCWRNMIFTRITFGKLGKQAEIDLENLALAEFYLASLL